MELAALILGFAGSIHCLGMCSPLVMAITGGGRAIEKKVVYNSGRVLTYGLLGALVATAGMGISVIRFQNIISLLLGCTFIVIGITGSNLVHIPGFTPLVSKFTFRLKTLFQNFLQKKNMLSIFTLGNINGLLPCGLTFSALAICLSLKGPIDGFLFMILFGAGTLPVMLGLTSFIGKWMRSLHWNPQAFTSIMMIASGSLLIIRVFTPHFHEIHSMTNVMEIVTCK